jgi:hypothetical protein
MSLLRSLEQNLQTRSMFEMSYVQTRVEMVCKILRTQLIILGNHLLFLIIWFLHLICPIDFCYAKGWSWWSDLVAAVD